jgi:hypothetical protein
VVLKAYRPQCGPINLAQPAPIRLPDPRGPPARRILEGGNALNHWALGAINLARFSAGCAPVGQLTDADRQTG